MDVRESIILISQNPRIRSKKNLRRTILKDSYVWLQEKSKQQACKTIYTKVLSNLKPINPYALVCSCFKHDFQAYSSLPLMNPKIIGGWTRGLPKSPWKHHFSFENAAPRPSERSATHSMCTLRDRGVLAHSTKLRNFDMAWGELQTCMVSLYK